MSGIMTTVTEHVHASVFDGPLPAKAVAEEIGKAYTTMQAELTGQERHKLGVETFTAILKATGDLAPLKFLCRRLDCALVDLGPARRAAREGSAQSLASLALKAMAELGQDSALLRCILEDGRITRREAEAFESEAWETVGAILASVEAVRLAAGDAVRQATREGR